MLTERQLFIVDSGYIQELWKFFLAWRCSDTSGSQLLFCRTEKKVWILICYSFWRVFSDSMYVNE